jgi:hypothetical protein
MFGQGFRALPARWGQGLPSIPPYGLVVAARLVPRFSANTLPPQTNWATIDKKKINSLHLAYIYMQSCVFTVNKVQFKPKHVGFVYYFTPLL